MRVQCEDHQHDVYLMDDGTLDTVLSIDGVEVRYNPEDDIEIFDTWMEDAAREACSDGLLEA